MVLLKGHSYSFCKTTLPVPEGQTTECGSLVLPRWLPHWNRKLRPSFHTVRVMHVQHCDRHLWIMAEQRLNIFILRAIELMICRTSLAKPERSSRMSFLGSKRRAWQRGCMVTMLNARRISGRAHCKKKKKRVGTHPQQKHLLISLLAHVSINTSASSFYYGRQSCWNDAIKVVFSVCKVRTWVGGLFSPGRRKRWHQHLRFQCHISLDGFKYNRTRGDFLPFVVEVASRARGLGNKYSWGPTCSQMTTHVDGNNKSFPPEAFRCTSST